MPKAKTLQVPWVKPDADLDNAAYRMISALKDSNSLRNNKETKLGIRDENHLTQLHKGARQAKSKANRFMYAIAKEIGIKNLDFNILMADGKNWKRAKEKSKDSSRNLHDLQRGRIYLSSPSRYKKLKSILKQMTKSGQLRGIKIAGVSIIPNSIDDYIEEAREKSGFAGSLNLDLLVDNGKGGEGYFEIQFMPSDYTKVDKQSHRLFDMIRILDEIPKDYRSEADDKIKFSLKIANQALYIEHGILSGFIDFRTDRPSGINIKNIQTAYGVLDRLRTKLDDLGGRDFSWKTETRQALIEVKTSLRNIELALEHNNPLFPTLAGQRKAVNPAGPQ